MPTPSLLALTTICLLLFPSAAVLAQDENRPLALLRRGADGAAFIRLQTNAKLPAGSRLSAILSNKDRLVKWQEDVKDCVAEELGKFCKRLDRAGRIELDFPLPGRPQTGDRFKVSFAISDSAGQGSFRSVDVLPDFKAIGPRADANCADGLIVDVKSDNPLLAEGAEAEYYLERIRALDAWLKATKSSPQDIAKVRIEPLTKSSPSEYVVKAFSVSPGVGGGSNAHDIDIERALAFQQISICLKFSEKLPDEKFNAEVEFMSDPPLELERAVVKTLGGARAMGSPTASYIPEENKLGLRSFENNLNLGVLYTSSVKEIRRGNISIRERQSRGSLDLRFAPLLRGRTRPPEVKKWQPFWTPFFLDAKVSTGRIADDSLSLNRILLGTDVTLRYYRGTERGHRDKYLLSLRGVNASDRDYKRAELKGEFEFRPIFEALNKPLRFRRRSEPSVLVPDAPPKEIPTGGFFGYQIEPFVGLEAGRIYRQSRSALKGEERGDTVRRLLFGTDMLFTLGAHLNLRLTETFYVRGGVIDGRIRNYFNGVVEVPLGNLSRNAAQSIFFSFERGNQPPFSSPSVNAMKFGYRVRSDFFAGGAAW
jgi:hypothetical protein